MNVRELKNRKDYEFECNISRKLCERYNDIWSAGLIWLGEKIGVEYNYCIQDDGTNCSAIYKMEFNEKTDYMDTDYTTFFSYEVDFNDVEWKNKLENAMCEALIEFFKL